MSFSFDELLAAYPGLKKFAMRLTKHTEAGEDLTSDTVIRMLEKQEFYQEGTNLFSWGSKIMFNLFVSQYRKNSKFGSQYDPDPYIMAETARGSQEDTCYLKQVLEEIESLPKPQKEVLSLIMTGNRYEEIAVTMGVPCGTVRSRLSRARKVLVNKNFN